MVIMYLEGMASLRY